MFCFRTARTVENKKRDLKSNVQPTNLFSSTSFLIYKKITCLRTGGEKQLTLVTRLMKLKWNLDGFTYAVYICTKKKKLYRSYCWTQQNQQLSHVNNFGALAFQGMQDETIVCKRHTRPNLFPGPQNLLEKILCANCRNLSIEK